MERRIIRLEDAGNTFTFENYDKWVSQLLKKDPLLLRSFPYGDGCSRNPDYFKLALGSDFQFIYGGTSEIGSLVMSELGCSLDQESQKSNCEGSLEDMRCLDTKYKSEDFSGHCEYVLDPQGHFRNINRTSRGELSLWTGETIGCFNVRGIINIIGPIRGSKERNLNLSKLVALYEPSEIVGKHRGLPDESLADCVVRCGIYSLCSMRRSLDISMELFRSINQFGVPVLFRRFIKSGEITAVNNL